MHLPQRANIEPSKNLHFVVRETKNGKYFVYIRAVYLPFNIFDS